MVRLVFLLSLGAIVYTYLIYPSLLLVLGGRRGRRDGAADRDGRGSPSVSVVLAAYNESRIIARKIENFLSCRYSGLSEMIIVSDGSTDETNLIASKYVSERVSLMVSTDRRGKDISLKDAARRAKGEILVFTDAGAIFARDALERLAEPFSDPSVGLVSGAVEYLGAGSAGLYRRYEDWLKSLESQWGVIPGANGPLYALRQSIWREELPPLINDFSHPALAALQGYESTVAGDAVCFQDRSGDNPLRRHVRIVAGAAAVMSYFVPRLFAARRWRVLFVLISHKVLRWITVPLAVGLAISAAALWDRGLLYQLTLLAEVCFLALAALGAVAARLGFSSKLRIPYDFIAVNVAATIGLFRWATGRVPLIWEPRGL